MSCQKSKIGGCFAKPAEVADLLETSARNLFRWRRDRNFPKPGADGRLDLRAVLAWHAAEARKAEGAPATDRAARVLLIEARTRKLKIESRILQERYVDREDVKADIMGKLYAIKHGLEALGRCLSRELVGIPDALTAQRRIDAATRDLLEAFASGYEGIGDFREYLTRNRPAVSPAMDDNSEEKEA